MCKIPCAYFSKIKIQIWMWFWSTPIGSTTFSPMDEQNPWQFFFYYNNMMMYIKNRFNF
jgi:hypothetical protein